MTYNELFEEIYAQIKLYKVPFFVVFFIVVLLTYGILFALDFYPEPVASAAETESSVPEAASSTEALDSSPVTPQESVAPDEIVSELSPLPVTIVFDALDKQIRVLNPESDAVSDLDTALLSGAVRHPDSADLTHKGNIFILGHSSYLPTVFNKNYQAFNGIQDLQWGDTIRLRSTDTEYVYRVQKVFKAKASDVVVKATPGQALLTLATCNSFGTKDDRFVVESALIETKPL